MKELINNTYAKLKRPVAVIFVLFLLGVIITPMVTRYMERNIVYTREHILSLERELADMSGHVEKIIKNYELHENELYHAIAEVSVEGKNADTVDGLGNMLTSEASLYTRTEQSNATEIYVTYLNMISTYYTKLTYSKDIYTNRVTKYNALVEEGTVWRWFLNVSNHEIQSYPYLEYTTIED